MELVGESVELHRVVLLGHLAQTRIGGSEVLVDRLFRRLLFETKLEEVVAALLLIRQGRQVGQLS